MAGDAAPAGSDALAGVRAVLAAPPPPPPPLAYGTAGFRAAAPRLTAAIVRAGLVAALRSRALGGAATGVVVTASHNPVADNGIKMMEPDGSMLEASWEPLATAIVNAPTVDAAVELLTALAARCEVPLVPPPGAPVSATVVIGRDTRPSSPSLAAALADAIAAVGGAVVDL
eukprot:contig_34817_g8364